ncbi:MAG: TatD family hydrolase [Methylomicrobium sp.]
MPLGAFIDIHSHREKSRNGTVIISIDMSEIASRGPRHGFYSVGIHPWFIGRQDCAESLLKIERAASDSRMLAVGECGLDTLTGIPLVEQEKIFAAQIELAERCGKPLLIHCVRAFNELLRIKTSLKPTQPWIIHGFNNKASIASRLLERGCYLSLGKALLHPESNAAKILPIVPEDRFFLETDDSDVSIESVYRAATNLRQCSLSELQQVIENNFNRVFLHDR